MFRGSGGGWCSGGTCGCGGNYASQCGSNNNNGNSAPKQSFMSCMCGTQDPCGCNSVTGKCCRPPNNNGNCEMPKPINITFKCPTYCTKAPVLMDPCCPPPVIPPTCPSPSPQACNYVYK